MLKFEEVHFITPDTMYVENGTSGSVKCGAQGSPMPYVVWDDLESQYSSFLETSEGTVGEHRVVFTDIYFLLKVVLYNATKDNNNATKDYNASRGSNNMQIRWIKCINQFINK